LWHIASFRDAAEFGRYRGADIDKAASIKSGRNSVSVFRQFNYLSAQYADAIAPYALLARPGSD
jgi:hypothetical protein